MHLFQERDEVGKLNMDRFALCSVWYSYIRLCMSRLVEFYRGPSCSLLISYVGVDRCVDSAGAGKPRGFYYVFTTAVPFFLPHGRVLQTAMLRSHRGPLNIEESRCRQPRSGTRGRAPQQLHPPSFLPSRDRGWGMGRVRNYHYSTRLTDMSRAPPLSSLWPRGGQVRFE